MKKRNVSVKTAQAVTGALDKMLKIDANSTSCLVVHQPKAPKLNILVR